MRTVRESAYSKRTMLAPEPHVANWTHFPHGADIAIRGVGSSPAEAFENAARAMIAAVVPLETIATTEEATVTCKAPHLEILLLDWLNAVIFEMAERQMLFCKFHVEINGNELRARLEGEAVDVARHAPAVELKGATLTLLRVAHDDCGRWIAQCVVDV